MSSTPVKRLLIIANPTAGRRRAGKLAKVIADMQRHGITVDLRLTAYAGHATEIAREARGTGVWDAIAAAGGDGTISEVVAGLLGSTMPLVILPFGTANVMAIELGISTRVQGMIKPLLSGKTVAVKVPVANGRSFVMMGGAGFDAQLTARIVPQLKKRLGKLAYVWAGIQQVRLHPQQTFAVQADGKTHQAHSLIFCNGRHYAGRFKLAPQGNVTRDDLEVVLIHGARRIDILKVLVMMGIGRVHKLRDVSVIRARELTITGPNGNPVELDGDPIAQVPLQVKFAGEVQVYASLK